MTAKAPAMDPETPFSGASTVVGQAIGRCRNGFLAVAVFSFFINLLLLTAPLYMLQVFTRVLTSRNGDTLLVLFIIAVAALATLALLDAIRGYLLTRIGSWIDHKVSGAVLQASVAETLAAGGDGASVQGLRDLAAVRGFLSGPSVLPILDAPWTPLFVAAMFLLHPAIGWIAVAGALVLIAIAVTNEFATRRLLMDSGGAAIKALEHADATVRNADVIAAMGMMPDIIRRWHDDNAAALAMQARAGDRGGTIAALAKFVRLVLQIAVLTVGAWLAIGGELNPGAMIAGSILMGRALAPIDQAISSWRGGVTARAAYRRLCTLLAANPVKPAGMALPTPQGSLEVEALSYRHPGGAEPVLRGVAFQLRPGESLGLIGPTAAGKTSLARLLIGNLAPGSGSVRLDGMDVAAWAPEDLGPHIGYLPQDVELFKGTINENIARMGEADAAAVVEAAKLAGVHDMVLRMPRGYDTPIGDGGAALSGGQRQRIALARAVYGDTRFLVLDEPNASLDNDGDQALIETLARLRQRGASVVIIAHRPSVLRHVDKILVLQNGMVQTVGPSDEVLAKIAGEKANPGRPADGGEAPSERQEAPEVQEAPEMQEATA